MPTPSPTVKTLVTILTANLFFSQSPFSFSLQSAIPERSGQFRGVKRGGLVAGKTLLKSEWVLKKHTYSAISRATISTNYLYVIHSLQLSLGSARHAGDTKLSPIEILLHLYKKKGGEKKENS